MIKVSWTPFALRCLEEIHDYVLNESKSESIADRLIDRIFKRTSQLSDFPESGQVEVFLKERSRSRYLVEGFYKIVYVYRTEKSEVIITDIFHTSQDPIKLNK